MNASRAKRRWIKWCRYVDKTQSGMASGSKWYAGVHRGQAKAYVDATFAGRPYPVGARVPYYPRWGMVKR